MADYITSRASRPTREKILLLTGYDAKAPFVEVYAGRHIDVHIASVPYVGTRQGEIVAEELVEHLLPRCYRELYFPGSLRAQAPVRRILPSDLVEGDHQLQLFRGLKAATDSRAAEPEEVIQWS